MDKKENQLANRIVLGGFTAIGSFLLWLAVIIMVGLEGVFAFKVVTGLTGITVLSVDRAYKKYQLKNDDNS